MEYIAIRETNVLITRTKPKLRNANTQEIVLQAYLKTTSPLEFVRSEIAI
jgi:hypothetical protein